MGMMDRIKNFFGEMFDGDTSHSTDKETMLGTGFDCENILGVDRGNAGEFFEFCDMNISDGARIETTIYFDRETGGTTHIEITHGDGRRTEVVMDRETGSFEATEYRADGSRYEYDIEQTREIKLEGAGIPSNYQIDNPWCGREYDAEGRMLSEDTPDEGHYGKVETEYTYDSEGRVEKTVSETYNAVERIVETKEYTYHDNGEIATIERTVGEVEYHTEDTFSETTTYREDGTKESVHTHETSESFYEETTIDKTVEYGSDGEHVDREVVTETTYYDYESSIYDGVESKTTTIEKTDDYTRTEIRETGSATEHTIKSEYSDGTVDVRTYDERDRGYIEVHYDAQGRIEAVTHCEDGRTERTEVYGDNGDTVRVETSRDGRLETVEYYDDNGKVESKDTIGQDGEPTMHSEYSYDGDKAIETVYSADGEYEKTITMEQIDDKVQVFTETGADGSEKEWAVADGEQYSLESIEDVDGEKHYSFTHDMSSGSTDGEKYIKITIDEKGEVSERTIGYGCEKIGVDSDGEDTVQWTEGHSERVEYHEDGSRTETTIDRSEGYRGSDIGETRYVEKTYDKDGNLEKEVYSRETHEAFGNGEGRGYVEIVEYDNGEKTETYISNVDSADIKDAIENPEHYDRDITYIENGEVTSEFVEAGAELPRDVEDIQKDVEQTPDETDATDGDLTPDGQDDEELEPYETDGELFREIEDGLRDGTEPTPEDGQDSKDDTEKPDKPEDAEYHQEDFDWYDTEGDDDDE